MGKWLHGFFSGLGYFTSFSSNDGLSQYFSNVHLTSDSDVIILAVPISKMESVLFEIFPYLNGKLLIDVCSVKTGVVNAFNEFSAQYQGVDCSYISIHPMFAPSVSTVQGQAVLFNHFSKTDAATASQWRALFADQGAQVQDIPYDQHDRLMGVIQGLNHFNVFVSAKTLAHMGTDIDFIKTLSSPSYRIFLLFYTRYVLQNPRLYAEIQIFNPYVKEVTRLFMKEAEILLNIIESEDFDGFEGYVKEIQPFFLKNKTDAAISDRLIEALGALLAHTSPENQDYPEPSNPVKRPQFTNNAQRSCAT